MKCHKIFAAGAMLAAMVLIGCSDDHIDGPDINAPEGDFYTTLKIEMPAGSRSNTTEWDNDKNTNSNNGYEVGQDWENQVNNILVILTKQDANFTYITHGYVINPQETTGTTNKTYTVRFNLSSFQGLIDDPETSEVDESKVYIFAFCNPNAEMVATFPDDDTPLTDVSFVDLIANPSLTSGTNYLVPWGNKNGGFLMGNHSLTTSASIPSVETLATHNTASNPFDLTETNNPVKVERASVRFDFQPQYETGSTSNLKKYPIYKTPGIQNDADLQGYVTLTDMTLINQANQYYWLRHVSADGTNTDWKVCGPESSLAADGKIRPNTTPYVVSPNFNDKQATNLNAIYQNTIKPMYTYSYYVADTRATSTFALDFSSIENWTAISSFAANFDEDNKNDETWTVPDGISKAGFYIWRYTTENTIPALKATDLVSSQRHAITTGVIFKGNITAAEGSALATSMGTGTTKNILYAFNGIIYGNKTDIIKAAQNGNQDSSLGTNVISLFKLRNESNQGQSNKEILDALTEDDIAIINDADGTSLGGITIYRPDANGNYPVYYPYYNRHNDNGNPGIMGVMEFATVRNNVYKLAVTNILQFGHPGKPGDDPDPDDPDDPDESAKIYFNLNVTVLPWIVRVNNIIL